MNWLKSATRYLFAMPSPEQIAKAELLEAQRALLKAASGYDYANAMVSYNQERIERLSRTLEMYEQKREDSIIESARNSPGLSDDD